MMKWMLCFLLAVTFFMGCGSEKKMRKEGEKAEVSESAKPAAPDFGSERP